MSKDIYDVTIIGAGPAGTTAAIKLAQKGRRVLLLDRAAFPRPVPCTGWVSRNVKPLLDEMGVKYKSVLHTPFQDVTFYNADFSKSAKPVFTEPPGYLIDRAEFDHELVKHAKASEVTFKHKTTITDIQLNELSVITQTDKSRSYESKLLLLACGRENNLLNQIGMSMDSSVSDTCIVHLEDKISDSKKPAQPRVTIILGLDDGNSYGLISESNHRISIDVCWFGSSDDAKQMMLKLCPQLSAHQIVSTDYSSKASKSQAIRNPPSAVMDMESHVGKHTLLIGDAGGFVADAGSEGIYPAMWSAKIAADTIDEALNNTHTQDTLMTYDSSWRMEMADYLRSPHTDIRFLLPLVFSNQPIADRMAAAMFLGENL